MAQFEDVELFEEELFRTVRVKELQNEDFMLNTVERIVLKAEGCSLVLFYLRENPASNGMRDIWNLLSERFAGVNFFAVNASLRVDIMRAFQQVSDDPDHPLSTYAIRGFPTILVYREGGEAGLSWPKAFYNGELSTIALQNWILQLACVPGYTETPALREGVVTENDIILEDPNYQEYGSYYDYEDEFEQDVLQDVTEQEELVQSLELERPIPSSNIRNFSTTDYPGSLDFGDAGFLEEFEDSDLNVY